MFTLLNFHQKKRRSFSYENSFILTVVQIVTLCFVMLQDDIELTCILS